MARHFSLIFWGLVLLVVDFSINGFDLFPDGLGYLLVASGCAGLVILSKRFSIAKVLGWVLAILWVLGFFVRGELGAPFGLIVTIFNCLMIWNLMGGVSDFANDRQRNDLAQRAETRRVAYCAIMAIATVLGYVLKGKSGGLAVVFVVLAMLVVMAMILHLIHRVKNELAGEHFAEGEPGA